MASIGLFFEKITLWQNCKNCKNYQTATIWPIHESGQNTKSFGLHFIVFNLAPNLYNLLFINHHIQQEYRTEAWEPYPTSKMELLAKIVNGWKTLTIFAKRSILCLKELSVRSCKKIQDRRISYWSLFYAVKLKTCLWNGKGQYFSVASQKQIQKLPQVFCKKKVFLEISQISQENTCIGVWFLLQEITISMSIAYQGKNEFKFTKVPSIIAVKFFQKLTWIKLNVGSVKSWRSKSKRKIVSK